jgi:recombination protein RecA
VSKDLFEALGKKSKRLTRLSDPDILSRVTEWIPTGCVTLDYIMGGGVPVGRMIEIFGDTSSGKTLLAEHIIAETQALGGVAAYLDSETAADEGVMENVGIDLDALIYSNPEIVEEVYEDFTALLEARQEADPDQLMTIIWDSVAATSTKAEIEAVRKKGMGAATMGIHARLISQMCRIVNTEIARQRLAVVFINQTRSKIGVMFGDPDVTFGGKAIAYYSSVRVKMRHIRKLVYKPTKTVYGIEVGVGVVKNKVGPPFGHCEIPILFDIGMDEPGAVLWWLKEYGLVTGSNWKTLILPSGEKVKFQHRSWEDTYYNHLDAIHELVTLDPEEDEEWEE